MFTKDGRDEVLMAQHMHIKMFWPYLPPGADPGRGKISHGGGGFPFFKKLLLQTWKATATKRIHSNDLEACVMKCCCFWFHSVVKFLTLGSSLLQKCSWYSGERLVPLWALVKGFFSASEPKAQVHYCDHALSVVRPSVRLSVRPSSGVNFSHFRLLL